MCCCNKVVASVISLTIFAFGVDAFAYRYVDFELVADDVAWLVERINTLARESRSESRDD